MEDSEQEQRAELEAQIVLLLGVQDPLSINEFLKPAQEVIKDNNRDIFKSIVERYSADKEGEKLIEEEDIKVKKVLIKEAT